MADHIREHRSLLARSEKQLLIAIARRLPGWVGSDLLTALALVSMGIAGLGYALATWDVRALWISIAAIVLNWFGDSLDGTVARVRGAERPRYGFYVDHVVDIAGAAMLLVGLAVSPYMSAVVALAVLGAYLLVSAEIYLSTCVHHVFRLSFGGVGPTELRVLLIVGTVFLRNAPQVDLGALGRWPLFDVGGCVAVAGLLLAFVISAWRSTRTLWHLEPLPPARKSKQSGPMLRELIRFHS
jgi:phosphatidylglycerophosphate synthase